MFVITENIMKCPVFEFGLFFFLQQFQIDTLTVAFL